METKRETKNATKKGKIYPCLTEVVSGTSVYIDDLYVFLSGHYSPSDKCIVIHATIFPSYSLIDVFCDEYSYLYSEYLYPNEKPLFLSDAISLVGNTLIDVFPNDIVVVACDGFDNFVNFKK